MSLHDKKFKVIVLSVVSSVYTVHEDEMGDMNETDLNQSVRNKAHLKVVESIEGSFYEHNVLHSGVKSVISIVENEVFADENIDNEFGNLLYEHYNDTSEFNAHRDFFPKKLIEKFS